MSNRLSRLFHWLYKGVPVVKVTPCISYLSDQEKLKNRKILIVGGSRGVGLMIARKCLLDGAEIAITGRNEQTLKKAADSLGDCKYFKYDMGNLEGQRQLLESVGQQLGGPIDSLVYCASLYLHETSILEVTSKGFDAQFSTNLKAPYFLSKYFIEYLKAHQTGHGNILFLSSEMGLYCNDVPYGLGKASLNSFVAGLSRRFIKDGIRINALAPGVLSNETEENTDGNLFRKYSCGQRFIMPEEVAEVASFMLSDASNCISGAIIPCNQGNHYRCDW